MSDKPATPEELALCLAEIAVKEGPWGDRFLDVDQAAALIAEAFERWAKHKYRLIHAMAIDASKAARRLAKWRDLTLTRAEAAEKRVRELVGPLEETTAAVESALEMLVKRFPRDPGRIVVEPMLRDIVRRARLAIEGAKK